MSAYDVHDAADRISAIERRALWSANHFDVVDRFWSEARDEQRVRDLDAVDIDLWIAHAERARAANARVRAQDADGRLRPAPHTRHVVIERARECVRVFARELTAAENVDAHGELALRR